MRLGPSALMALLFNPSAQLLGTSRTFVKLCSSNYSSSLMKWGDDAVSMVQGASRGIGLQFVRQLLEKHDKGHVVATCRNPEQAVGLGELRCKFGERLNILQLDTTSENTIERHR